MKLYQQIILFTLTLTLVLGLTLSVVQGQDIVKNKFSPRGGRMGGLMLCLGSGSEEECNACCHKHKEPKEFFNEVCICKPTDPASDDKIIKKRQVLIDYIKSANEKCKDEMMLRKCGDCCSSQSPDEPIDSLLEMRGHAKTTKGPCQCRLKDKYYEFRVEAIDGNLARAMAEVRQYQKLKDPKACEKECSKYSLDGVVDNNVCYCKDSKDEFTRILQNFIREANDECKSSSTSIECCNCCFGESDITKELSGVHDTEAEKCSCYLSEVYKNYHKQKKRQKLDHSSS